MTSPAVNAPAPWSSPTRFGIGVVLTALAAAAFAIVFRWTLSQVYFFASGFSNVVSSMEAAPIWLRLLLPAVGGLLAGLIGIVVARGKGGQGVADVMEAVVLGRVKLSLRVTLLKSAASWMAIVTGGSLGREGPLIQFGGAIGKVFAEKLRLPVDTARLLIASGVAAGFAAAYNTPFAAVLFVLEVVLGVVVVAAIVPAMVAAAIAAAVTREVVGVGPIYGHRLFELEAPIELLALALLGIVVAVGAQGFMRLLSASEGWFRRGFLPLPWRPALGGLLAGGVIAIIPSVAGNGFEPLNELLDGRLALGFVALLLLGKCFATASSVSSGSPGGVFTPILLLGGCIGYLYAHGLSAMGLGIGPAGGYALVGMAAATAASTHAPLMAAVMVFELSGDYAIALPLIVATALATLMSRWMRTDSIYGAELRERGVGWEVTLDGRRIQSAPTKE